MWEFKAIVSSITGPGNTDKVTSQPLNKMSSRKLRKGYLGQLKPEENRTGQRPKSNNNIKG